MIIINKSGYLKYKNLKFRCSYGKGGIGKKRREGDNITPIGTYKIIAIYYRSDRIKKILSNCKLIKIKRNMGWCDDPKNRSYNKLIKLPFKGSHEKLYRADRVYDLIAILNYNMNPIIKNKGSAIFIHIAKRKFSKTAGCIALRKQDLLVLLAITKKNTKIKIQ